MIIIPFIFVNSLQGQCDLVGSVLDSSGQAFVNMEIRITQLDLIARTDKNGAFKFENIKEGEYALALDHEFDIEYRKVIVKSGSNYFHAIIDRRIRFDEVTVIQSRLEQANLNSTQNLLLPEIEDRITEKDIPYILETLPNIQVQSDAGNGVGYTEVRIRGIDPQHIQYSLNGIPLNDAESSRMYLVDIPDMINSTDKLSVHSGFVPGRSGSGAFGASIDLFTNRMYFKPFAKIKTRFGSYNNSSFSLQGNSGLIEGKYNLEVRLSGQKSDGFIDRSSSRLKSFSISGTRISKNYNLRFNIFNGRETVQQAWNGLPYKYFYIDSLYTYNSAGQERPNEPYKNEIDYYKQTHVQFFYNQAIGRSTISLHSNYTRGIGYFENYKADQVLINYGLTNPFSDKSDIIRQKWLDNHFLYQYAGIETRWNRKLSITGGIALSYYLGNQFGKAIWSDLEETENLNSRYYNNNSRKMEFGSILKLNYAINQKFSTGIDFHHRTIQYSITGLDEVYGNLKYNQDYNLFSPKLYLISNFHKNLKLDFSAAYYEREPNRQDVLSNPYVNKEKLIALDLGLKYTFLKESSFKINLYSMNYRDYLALNGEINNTGDPLRINIDNAYRRGIEGSLFFKTFKRIELVVSGSLSNNKTKNYNQKVIEFYNPTLTYKDYFKKSTNLAFSPSIVHYAELKFKAFNSKKDIHQIYFSIGHKFVSSQYLDLSNEKFSKLLSYQILHAKVNYKLELKKISLSCFFQLNNILNERYSSNGWLSTYFVGNNPSSADGDPYAGYDSELLYYKGLFPQALRHSSFGVDIGF